MQTGCALLLLVAVGCVGAVDVHPCIGFDFLWRALGYDCTSYRLKSFPTLEVDSGRYITIADRSNTPAGVPDSLLGVHYMDGNPLADELVSFAGCEWEEATNTCNIQVYGERVWGWSDNNDGEMLYWVVRQTALVYKVKFNSEKTFAEVTPTSNNKLEIPRVFVKFDMYLGDDNTWVRNTTYVNSVPVPDYYFRRIVNADGTRTASWDRYYVPSVGASGKTLRKTQLYAERLD
eukprot:TRINITY_DN37228_c0_g1_i1.p1 TRINITY_DN37228_c0_g1~~TRINITY_DN37228_c0_g1_i1.p1  ORF type:complete len:233 (+),score=63.28 TRINITY_DN37228_c0_g1_i1:76-774(+)